MAQEDGNRPNHKTHADVAPAAAKSHFRSWFDPWVSKLAQAAGGVTDAVLIAGYLGESSDEKAVRIFLDANLHLAVDVPVEGVIHREEISRDVYPLGGSYLWISSKGWSERKVYQRQWAFSSQAVCR